MKKIGKILLSLGLAVSMTFNGQYISGVTDGSNCVTAATKVKINKTKASIYVGKTVQLKVTGTKKKVTWKSSNKKIATVTSKGKVKGVKKGTAKITATVSKKKYTCKVTVKNKAVKVTPTPKPTVTEEKIITYISDRKVEYDEISQEHKLFFSLKLQDKETRVSSSGVANIKIVNEDNVEVYNQQVKFNRSNFGNWTWALSGTKYVCCIKIPDSELIKSTSKKGKLTFNVKLDDGVSFSDSTYSLFDLPLQDLKEVCRIAMPATPASISDLHYSGKIQTIVEVTDVNYSVEKSSEGTYRVTISFSGEKKYDMDGDNYSRTCLIGWKLYKDNNVVADSGTIYTTKLAVGEKFENETDTIYVLETGNYRLELLDCN